MLLQLSIVSSTGASQPKQMQTRRRRCHGYSGAGVVELLSAKRRVTFVQSEEGALQSDGKGLQEVHRDTLGARFKHLRRHKWFKAVQKKNRETGMKSALNMSHPKTSTVKNTWRFSPNAPRRSCAFSGPAVGRRTCCISSRGSGGRARRAPLLRAPPPLRCESRSLCSCGAWPPAGSCPAAAGSHKARCSESPRRSGLQETPPEGGADGRSACGTMPALWSAFFMSIKQHWGRWATAVPADIKAEWC